jgi:hypothetical protein
MTRAHLRAHWSDVPSLNQPWLVALLRAFAMLVFYAASIVRMRFSLLSGECHTDAEPETLPEPESGNLMETEEAAASSQTTVQLQLTCATVAAIGCCGGGSGCGDCHPGSAQRYPGPIPRHRDSQANRSRLYGAHPLRPG